MKTTLLWAITAIAIGAVSGMALGYWEARPWKMPSAEQASVKVGSDPAATAQADDAQPRAVIAETTFNFDKMESGTSQRHVFPIVNEGKTPLTIEFVSHTCKCTTVELDGRSVEPGASAIVKPGEKAEVLLVWAAETPAGPFRHGATFTTNDPTHSRLEITVEGDVVASTTLMPSLLNFGGVNVGKPATAEMFVLAFLEPEVEILSHEVTDEKLAKQVEVTIEPVEKSALPSPDAQAGVKVIATFHPDGSIGSFAGSLKLKTNLKRAPDVKVPIYGTVKGDVSIFGKGWNEPSGLLRLDPATSAGGTSTRLNVGLRGPHAKTTELQVASVKPPELKATLGQAKVIREDLVQVPLTVSVPPGTRPMVMAGEDQGGEGKIVLSTTHPETPEVRLRVMFTVKQ